MIFRTHGSVSLPDSYAGLVVVGLENFVAGFSSRQRTLAYLAGHGDFSTTRRDVHPNMEPGRAAFERAAAASGGHSSGHTAETTNSAQSAKEAVFQ